MKRLLKQLDSIKAIVDTFSPNQILDNPQEVERVYQIYADSYEPIYSVVNLKNQLIDLITSKNPVNGYLSADFGYGKTATLVYLWQVCQEEKILAIPPFKFKELADIITACYGWIKYNLQQLKKTELVANLEDLYSKYRLKSQEIRAEELAQKYKISPKKALQIIQEDLKTDTTNTNSVLGFWQECVPLILKAGFKGLVIFADEIQEFLRTEEGASVRIQVLSDLVKGMRALGTTPVGLILSMPTDPTESAIAEQAGDIIHRMEEQKVSLRLADAYTADFPVELWQFLCDKFLDNPSDGEKLVHPATIESLGQICDRKDLSNAPRTTVEVLKRLVTVAVKQKRAYTPLDLSEDYFNGQVQFYGTQQHRINLAVQTLEQLPAVYNHPQGKQIVRLLAMFPDGLSEDMAESLGMNKSLRDIVDDENLYGIHILQVEKNRYALEAISRTNKPTVVDKVLNSFRKRWFREWSNQQKKENAVFCFRDYILPLLFPASKSNWSWRKTKWFEDRYAWYNFILGSPQRYQSQFPNRSIVISVPHTDNNLMQFRSPESTHLDWRFYLHNDNDELENPPQLLSIAGTNQVDFNLRLNSGFANGYPASFGLLSKVITAEQCTVLTLLNLSLFIKDWLKENPDISKSYRDRLEYHRRECHQYAIRLLFTKAENWDIHVLTNIVGSEKIFISSVFEQHCQILFPDYYSLYQHLKLSLFKHKLLALTMSKVIPYLYLSEEYLYILKQLIEIIVQDNNIDYQSILHYIFKENQFNKHNHLNQRKIKEIIDKYLNTLYNLDLITYDNIFYSEQISSENKNIANTTKVNPIPILKNCLGISSIEFFTEQIIHICIEKSIVISNYYRDVNFLKKEYNLQKKYNTSVVKEMFINYCDYRHIDNIAFEYIYKLFPQQISINNYQDLISFINTNYKYTLSNNLQLIPICNIFKLLNKVSNYIEEKFKQDLIRLHLTNYIELRTTKSQLARNLGIDLINIKGVNYGYIKILKSTIQSQI